jgi:hypothetical protein
MTGLRLVHVLTLADKHKTLLSKFERELVEDRVAAFQKYGLRTRITPKQEEILEEIAEKLGGTS